MEAIGFISFWGFTPAIDFFSGTTLKLTNSEEEPELNILLSECADLRHLLRTLSDNLTAETPRKAPLNIYVHEKYRENLCRDILFLTILCEKHLSMRER